MRAEHPTKLCKPRRKIRVKFHTEESMVDESSVNAQPISERAVKSHKAMCAASFFAGFDAYINRSGQMYRNITEG